MKLTEAHERWLVYLICLHSLLVGAMLLAVPQWSIRFGGWEGVDQTFFVRQAGIFHVVVVAGYLIEFLRYRGVLLMISAKCIAVVFLLTATALLDPVPWAVPFSGVGDGAMALVVYLVHRAVKKA